MFTGIIEAVGHLTHFEANKQGAKVTIACEHLDMSDVQLGDSIASNGVCLTVVKFTPKYFIADLSSETLNNTGFKFYKKGQAINLEKAMLATTRFGGHMVSGHVDTLAQVQHIEQQGNSTDFYISLAPSIAPYVAHKGSITIDGVSLTVNDVYDDKFRLTIVPHTQQQTIIAHYKVGDNVNLEVDVVARYVERLLSQTKHQSKQSTIDTNFLARTGFLK